MPKHGDIRKVTTHFIHDGKVLKKEEEYQQYRVYYSSFWTGDEGHWNSIDTMDKVIEVTDLSKYKEGYYE